MKRPIVIVGHCDNDGKVTVDAMASVLERRTERCPSCEGRGTIRGAMNKKYIRGIGFRSVPIKCSTCKGSGRTQCA